MRIEAKGLHKVFDGRVAVEDLTFAIEPGQILGVLGPNGAGKSTTIRMLTGQLAPSEGAIRIDGKDYARVPAWARHKMGVMPQETIIWDDLTVLENLQFSTRLQSMKRLVAKQRIYEIIDALHLSAETGTLAKNLSGGFKRRLNLAISIIHEPEVIFLDEPSPGIDTQNRVFLWEYIKNLGTTKERSVVLTDHYIEEAERVCDQVVIIDKGQIIAQGTVGELKKRYGKNSLLLVELRSEDQERSDFVSKVLSSLEKIHSSTKYADGLIMIQVDTEVGSVINKTFEVFNRHHLNPASVNIKEPSLEEVFLELTGRQIRE